LQGTTKKKQGESSRGVILLQPLEGSQKALPKNFSC